MTRALHHLLCKQASHKPICFSAYMQQALYHPQLGYYQKSALNIGEQGDFTTAPELSPLFGRCLARYIRHYFGAVTERTIVEFGAGSGALARQLIEQLSPQQYDIIEVSHPFKEQQKKNLKSYNSARWPSAPPSDTNAIIIANELLDAFAAQWWQHTGDHWQRAYVKTNNDANQLSLIWMQETPPCHFPNMQDWHPFQPYIYSPEHTKWLQSLRSIASDVILFDYGGSEQELRHIHSSGVRCYHAHQQQQDPLENPGECDLTYDVNFTPLLQAPDWQIEKYCSQGNFMRDWLQDSDINPDQSAAFFKKINALKTLLMPDQMGDIFKFIHLR